MKALTITKPLSAPGEGESSHVSHAECPRRFGGAGGSSEVQPPRAGSCAEPAPSSLSPFGTSLPNSDQKQAGASGAQGMGEEPQRYFGLGAELGGSWDVSSKGSWGGWAALEQRAGQGRVSHGLGRLSERLGWDGWGSRVIVSDAMEGQGTLHPLPCQHRDLCPWTAQRCWDSISIPKVSW